MLCILHVLGREDIFMQDALGIDAAIGSDDLALLDEVLTEWCSNHGVSKSSPQAQAQAKHMIDLFEHGWKNRAELKAMLSPVK
jgi:hypothetical protein